MVPEKFGPPKTLPSNTKLTIRGRDVPYFQVDDRSSHGRKKHLLMFVFVLDVEKTRGFCDVHIGWWFHFFIFAPTWGDDLKLDTLSLHKHTSNYYVHRV